MTAGKSKDENKEGHTELKIWSFDPVFVEPNSDIKSPRPLLHRRLDESSEVSSLSLHASGISCLAIGFINGKVLVLKGIVYYTTVFI